MGLKKKREASKCAGKVETKNYILEENVSADIFFDGEVCYHIFRSLEMHTIIWIFLSI